jgi:hypothetical protein
LNEETRLEDAGRRGGSAATTLPRASFEMTGLTYAENRKRNTSNKIVKYDVTGADSTLHNYTFEPVPYDINFSLHIAVRNIEDGLQIVEQIIPWFTPEFSVTINMESTVGGNMDVPFIIDSVTQEDIYDGSFEDRRVLTWQLDFTAKTYIWGPNKTSDVIREVIANVFTDDAFVIKEEIITVVPVGGATADEDFETITTIT